MNEKQLFQEAWAQYRSNNELDTFISKIIDLSYRTYLWYYMMAFYCNKNEGDCNKAAEYISAAIGMLKDMYLKPNLFEIEDENLFLINEGKRGILIAEYVYLKDIAPKVYELAGEVYAKLGSNQESLAAYQQMHYLKNRLTPKIDTELDSIVVYSFRSINEYSLADIINNEITVVHPSKMNDPFDSIANLWSQPEVLSKQCKEMKHIESFSKAFNSYRIRSFIANKKFTSDNKIIKNILMWSHYASSHTGCCIKYKLSDYFINKKPKEKYGDNDFHHYISPITYIDGKNVDLTNRSISSDDAYVKKSKHWKYEKEVRLVSYNAMARSPFWGIPLDDNSQIEAIYFGYNSSEESVKLLKNVLANNLCYKNIKLYKMVINSDVNIYNLIPQEITWQERI